MINVNIIRAFEGPRHERLELLWAVIAEYCKKDISLHIYPNLGAKLSHAECLNYMWIEELKRPEPFALITEFDFLPNLRTWLPTKYLLTDAPVLAAEYCTREPESSKLLSHDLPGAWYILIDKTRVGDLDFSGAGPFNDPANGLGWCVRKRYNAPLLLLTHSDCYPRHYGAEMLVGEHLFFSRHIHDDPDMKVAGLILGDIQKKHDRAVEFWIRRAPPAFQRLLKKRLKPARSTLRSAL